jgi:hypothetical protein
MGYPVATGLDAAVVGVGGLEGVERFRRDAMASIGQAFVLELSNEALGLSAAASIWRAPSRAISVSGSRIDPGW